MLDRNARINRHLKANKQTLKKGLPSNSEGSNGDVTIREIGSNTQQFVKKNGSWKPLTNQATSVKKTIVIESGGNSSSSAISGGGGTSNHPDLSGLTASDDHTQYMHNTTARTVTANHAFTGSPSFTNIDINGGDIASGTVINKSPVVNFNSGDVQGSITLSNLASGTGSLTIQANSVALGTDTTGNYMSNVTGNSQVSVSHSQGEGSTASLSIANDSIGDTQLEYNTGQPLTTSSAVTFATVNTGQGANELYDMNQNVLTTSSPQFSNMTFGEYSDPNYSNGEIGTSTFASGFAGKGWKISKSGNEYNFETNNMLIRGTLSVYELLIQQVRATNGAIFVSSSAKVESWDNSNSQITFEDPSENNICPFAVNDLIMMQRVKPGSFVASNAAGNATDVIKKLVYRVTAVSGKVVTVTSASNFTNTSTPSSGDDFVRIGNTSTAARQGIIYLTSDDSNSPFIDIKADIDSYSDWTGATPKVRLGKLDGITDSDLGGSLSGFGLYSNNIFLKGKIVANSGSIGGISLDSSKIYTGSGSHNNSNTGFYIDSSSNFSLGDKLSWNGSALSINGSITVTNTSDFAPTNATANDTDANLKSRGNHTGTQGVSSLDSTIISGGKIITGLLTADNIQTGTLTGRTVTVTQDSVAKTEISPTRTAKSFDGGSNWHNYPNILVYEFTSSGDMDLIAFKATYGYPGAFNVNNDYFDLTSSSSLNNAAAVNVLTRYTNLYPIASFHNNVSGTGWKGWSPDDAYQGIQMLVTDQAATGSNIKQVRFTSTGSPFNSGDYRIIFLTEIYS